MHSPTRCAAAALLCSTGCAANPAPAPARPAHQVIATTTAPAAIGPYSQGVIAQQMLHAAGQTGLDPATVQVAALPSGALVAIDLIAVVP